MRILLLLCALALPAGAVITPFGQRVNAAIDRALGNLRGIEANGNIGGRATGLAVLCFLERRASADWGAPAVGYAGMDAADQALVRRAIAYMVGNDAGLTPGGTPYTYQTGSSVMALALYLDTGGPDNVGAARGAGAALQQGVANLVRIQNGAGGWNYGAPAGDNDLSTTQFVLAGLAAAQAVVPVDRNVITRAAASTDAHHEGAGCYGYRTNGWAGCSSSMTASALWVQRLGERGAEHANVQRSMRWLRDNWRYDGHIAAPDAGWGNNSYYYYLWAVAKGLEVTGGDAANLVLADDVGGARDPAADNYPEEPRSWYYDIAWSLTQRQRGGGDWPSAGNRSCWDGDDGAVSCTSFATLVLLRSLGGVCIDQDGDEVEFRGDPGECLEDNCPDVPNPDQADRDGNGVGDACEMCNAEDEVCDGADNDCDGEVDENAADEVCDGVDNDCDGEVDENAADEVCDGADNDCDGVVDEGHVPQGCDTGQAGPCAAGVTECRDGEVGCLGDEAPAGELCDGLDNDCDEAVDEDVPGGEACETGIPGVCGPGVEVCRDGDWACAPEIDASVEVCDGLDNDCDDAVDEDFEGDGEVCATGEPGICRDGVWRCANGEVVCEPDAAPGDEACNVVDDDCDGLVDEGQRNACGRCGETPEEVCNGLDDDCDGEVDDEAPCPGVTVCRWGRCVDPCQNNECAGDEVCIEGLCADPCDVAECAADEVCVAGECVDPCAGVGCDAGEVCVGGDCVRNDCFATGCPEGERCVDFLCEPDPCVDVECAANEFCREGRCVDSCATVSCPRGERCVDGACVAHDCADLLCADGMVCAEGECGDDPCAEVECLEGQACDDGGDCGDDPCLHVECPEAERCDVVDGQAQCLPDWHPGGEEPADVGVPDASLDAGVAVDSGVVFTDGAPIPETDAKGGGGGGNTPDPGGCTCDSTESTGGASWLLLVLGFRRRRC